MKLSDRERQVLEALWAAPEGLALGQTAEALKSATGWSRNTVLTYLTRMEAKGLVTIDRGPPLTATGRRWPGRTGPPRSAGACWSGCTRARRAPWWPPS